MGGGFFLPAPLPADEGGVGPSRGVVPRDDGGVLLRDGGVLPLLRGLSQ